MRTVDYDVAALKRKEPNAVESWFRAHADSLYSFVRGRVGGDADLAADLVQETLATALSRLDDFDPDRGAMQTWLGFLARNCIRTSRRQRARFTAPRTVATEFDVTDALVAIDSRELPDEVIQRHQTADLVREALRSLPESQRDLLVARYWRQIPLAEVAARLGITEGATKVRLHRARLAFRDALVGVSGQVDGISRRSS